MSQTALDLDMPGEVHRFSVMGWGRASLLAIADDADAGVVEVRRAYGESGPTVPYSPAKTIPLDGSAPVDLEVDDASHLAVFVTTAGAGTFDLETFVERPIVDELDEITSDLDSDPTIWSRPITPEYGVKVSIVSALTQTPSGPDVALRASVDPQGHAVPLSGGSVALDGTLTTIEVHTRGRVDLYNKADPIIGDLFIYCSRNPTS